MDCPECKIVDMRVDKVEGDIYYFKCPKCGHEETKEIKDE